MAQENAVRPAALIPGYNADIMILRECRESRAPAAPVSLSRLARRSVSEPAWVSEEGEASGNSSGSAGCGMSPRNSTSPPPAPFTPETAEPHLSLALSLTTLPAADTSARTQQPASKPTPTPSRTHTKRAPAIRTSSKRTSAKRTPSDKTPPSAKITSSHGLVSPDVSATSLLPPAAQCLSSTPVAAATSLPAARKSSGNVALQAAAAPIGLQAAFAAPAVYPAPAPKRLLPALSARSSFPSHRSCLRSRSGSALGGVSRNSSLKAAQLTLEPTQQSCAGGVAGSKHSPVATHSKEATRPSAAPALDGRGDVSSPSLSLSLHQSSSHSGREEGARADGSPASAAESWVLTPIAVPAEEEAAQNPPSTARTHFSWQHQQQPVSCFHHFTSLIPVRHNCQQQSAHARSTALSPPRFLTCHASPNTAPQLAGIQHCTEQLTRV
ncbi:unnamed protein product [Closterium sp. Naga37s-1]|nr:unnamed protein product [Closterium sp. Naga37s-1]